MSWKLRGKLVMTIIMGIQQALENGHNINGVASRVFFRNLGFLDSNVFVY